MNMHVDRSMLPSLPFSDAMHEHALPGFDFRTNLILKKNKD